MNNIVRWPPRPPQGWCPPPDQCDCECEPSSSLDRLQQCWNDTRQFKSFIQQVVESVLNGMGVSQNNPGPNPPSNPTLGLPWWDTSTGQLMIWDGTNWIAVGSSVMGVTDGSEAVAGTIGEYKESLNWMTGVTQTGTQTMVVTSLLLSPGDWNVEGSFAIGGQETNAQGMLSTLTGLDFANGLPSTSAIWPRIIIATAEAVGDYSVSLQVNPIRLNISVATTVYLYIWCNQPGSFLFGGIYARRMR